MRHKGHAKPGPYDEDAPACERARKRLCDIRLRGETCTTCAHDAFQMVGHSRCATCVRPHSRRLWPRSWTFRLGPQPAAKIVVVNRPVIVAAHTRIGGMPGGGTRSSRPEYPRIGVSAFPSHQARPGRGAPVPSTPERAYVYSETAIGHLPDRSARAPTLRVMASRTRRRRCSSGSGFLRNQATLGTRKHVRMNWQEGGRAWLRCLMLHNTYWSAEER